MKILIIDDEEKLIEPIRDRLKREKYFVDFALDGLDGFIKAKSDIYDLIILDVMLPYKDGFTVLKELKENNIKAPVIMLTAKSTIEDKLVGFKNGADDYLAKPFHLEELVARVNAKLKKSEVSSLLEFGDIVLDLDRKVLSCEREEIELMCKEFLLTECLMRHVDQILSKDFLYRSVWGEDITMSNNLEAYISFIRKKLKIIGSDVVIKSVRGLGYKLKVKNG